MITKVNKFPAVNNRNIYSAIYSILIYLRPKYCLEIGTFHGKSAEVFQEYFDNYMPDGKLITCDIKKYVNLSHLKNVEQVIVHPHVTNSTQWHYVKDEELLPPSEDITDNINLVKKVFDEKFDFCFLDGDHQWKSIEKDFEFATKLLKEPYQILFDDIDEPGKSVKDAGHDSVRFYDAVIKPNHTIHKYDFADWGEWVGAVLLDYPHRETPNDVA